MQIYLIGFMGSGKSTLGKRLARALNFQYVDLDNYIEQKNMFSIAQLFEKFGEAHFRELEKAALHDMFRYTGVVVATGGGTPCFFDNIEQMNGHGKTIYLRVPVGALANRLQHSHVERPLLKNKTPDEILQYIAATLQKREPFYNQAHHIIEGMDIKAEQLVTLTQKFTL